VGGAIWGGLKGAKYCAPAGWVGIAGCGSAGIVIGGTIGQLGGQQIAKCHRECWTDFKHDLAWCQTSRKWSGAGTIEFGSAHSDTEHHQRMGMNGPFAITLEVLQDGTIRGEGTATLTLALELFVEGSLQCTANGQGTVPLNVSGVATDGQLKLMFGSNPEGYHTTASCSGEPRAAEALRSRGYVELLFDIFFDQMQPLEVGAADEAEGQLVEDISEQARQAGAEAPGRWRRIWSLRLKALPPEEKGSRPVSGDTGHSAPELSGPLLSDQ
jgi:hypothetical protein